MPRRDPVLEKMREICLALPDAKLTMTWDSPHFRVGEKIFAGCGEKTVGFKLEAEHAEDLIETDKRFTRAPYVGRYGWVQMDISKVRDWDEVRELVHESYRLIAPKKLSKKISAPRS